MIEGQKVIVVMPAYNAGDTLVKTWREVIQHEIVDLVIVVDDASHDQTLAVARTLPKVVAHSHAAAMQFRLARMGLFRSKRFPNVGTP